MTAINPARLRIQCAGLGESFQEPSRFVSGLHDLLAFYGARIRQTSLSRTPLSIQTYQVPGPVLKALELELDEQISKSPGQVLSLVDALWQEEWLEFRHLAVSLLGNTPGVKTKQVLSRIRSWMINCPTEDIRRQIMTRGLRLLTSEKPDQVLDFLRDLGASEKREDRQAALTGLVPFAENPDFDNFPAILNILRDILLVEETALVKEISTLLVSLQRRSDQETAYFLARQMATASKPRIFRVTRQVLGYFSRESQALLRESLSTYK
jgi:hypothetical protein